MKPQHKKFKADSEIGDKTEISTSGSFGSYGESPSSPVTSDTSGDPDPNLTSSSIDVGFESDLSASSAKVFLETSDSESDQLSQDQPVDEVSLCSPTDPLFCIPSKAIELVTQHLSSSEVKLAMEVCRNWRNEFSRSKSSMRKLTLNVGIDGPGWDEQLSQLCRTPRQYVNIDVRIGNNKEVQRKVDAILKRLASTVENLKISRVGGLNGLLMEPLALPNLKTFELSVVCGRQSGDFLQCVCTLKKLSVNGLDPATLLRCLVQNPELQELTLVENAFISYFHEDFSVALPFELKKLSIRDHVGTGFYLDGEFPAELWDAQPRLNFLQLLKSQPTIESLHMDVCFAADLRRILSALPALKCLEVSRIVGEQELKLGRNVSVASFVTLNASDPLLHTLSACFVNLTSLFIFNLKTHQFFFIIRNFRHLRNFGYFWASASEKFQGNYVDLKAFYNRITKSDPTIKANIKVQVMKKENFLQMIVNNEK